MRYQHVVFQIPTCNTHMPYLSCTLHMQPRSIQRYSEEFQICSNPTQRITWLVVSTPLKNISQLGLLFHISGKIKNVPIYQPVTIHYVTLLLDSWETLSSSKQLLLFQRKYFLGKCTPLARSFYVSLLPPG